MDIDYGILEEFNINKEEALTHINKSVQVNKFIEAICDNTVYKSIRKTKSNKLKELLVINNLSFLAGDSLVNNVEIINDNKIMMKPWQSIIVIEK